MGDGKRAPEDDKRVLEDDMQVLEHDKLVPEHDTLAPVHDKLVPEDDMQVLEDDRRVPEYDIWMKLRKLPQGWHHEQELDSQTQPVVEHGGQDDLCVPRGWVWACGRFYEPEPRVLMWDGAHVHETGGAPW